MEQIISFQVKVNLLNEKTQINRKALNTPSKQVGLPVQIKVIIRT
jgi:hypothetical protein